MPRYKAKAKRYLCPARRKGKRLAPPDPYRSWLEADVAHALRKRKVKFEYEPHKITYVEPATVRQYTPDLILGKDQMYIEIKGRFTAQDRKKMSLIIEQHPELDIRMLLAKDNTISKNSKTRYSTWCAKRGIKYHIGQEVPDDWLSELK